MTHALPVNWMNPLQMTLELTTVANVWISKLTRTWLTRTGAHHLNTLSSVISVRRRLPMKKYA